MLPRVVPTAVAALGLGAAVAGVVMLTVAAPVDAVGGSTPVDGVLVTEPGVLALTGQPLQVELSGAGSEPVFLGVGRPEEVQAWLGDVEHVAVEGLVEEGVLQVTEVAGSPYATGSSVVADPAAAGLWQRQVVADGEATLSLVEPGPADVLLASAPGSGEVVLRWERSVRHPGGWPMAAGGALVGVLALMWLVALNARRRRASRRPVRRLA